MKKHIATLTTLAALMMGVSGISHAAGTDVYLKASVDETTCDAQVNGSDSPVNASFGAFTPADMFTFTHALPKQIAPFTIVFTGCTGADVVDGGVVNLTADGSTALGSLTATSAFGDPAVNNGYGFNLAVANATTGDAVDGGILAPATPSLKIFTAADGDGALAGLVIPSVTVTPQLFSYALAADDIVSPSTLATTVTLKVAYN